MIKFQIEITFIERSKLMDETKPKMFVLMQTWPEHVKDTKTCKIQATSKLASALSRTPDDANAKWNFAATINTDILNAIIIRKPNPNHNPKP